MKHALIRFDAACRAIARLRQDIARAQTVADFKRIQSDANAWRAAAKAAQNRTLEVDAAEIRIRNERRLGELIGAQKATVGLADGGDAQRTRYRKGTESIRPTLAAAGIEKKLSARAQQLAAVPLKQFDPMIAEWRDRVLAEHERVTINLLREGTRDDIRRARAAAPPIPTGLYRLIYTDPPWQYEHVETESRAIENQYPTMSLEAIKALAVPAADDAVLFLWATSPKLAEAIDVIRAWRFDYRTCAVWDKEILGMGYYFRQQHELLLVAARGTLPVPEPGARVASVIRSRRGGHSEKPAIVYEILETMYPTFTERDRIELFCRAPRDGWSAWGNEPAIAS